MKKGNEAGFPLVSIVVLNWNGMKYLEKCLRSLMSQTYPNYEVIVVDNGSSDSSVDFIKKSFSNVRLIENKANLGFAKGNNIGLRASRGDFIVLFNNDAVADPSWLFELVKTAMQSPKIGIASGVILQGQPSDIIWAVGMKMDAFTGSAWRVGYGKNINNWGKVEDVDYFSACAILMRRDAIETVGLLDEGFFFFSEDADWTFSARRAGYECAIVPSAIAWHEGSATSKTMPESRFYWYNLSNFRLLLKQFPIRYLFSALFFQLIFIPFLQVFLFKYPAKYLLLKLKAFIFNMVSLPKTISGRKKVGYFGELDLKVRLRELLKVVVARETGREF